MPSTMCGAVDTMTIETKLNIFKSYLGGKTKEQRCS